MLLRTCLVLGVLVFLCALFVHLRKHKRVTGGVVLAAALLNLQALVHPAAGQVIVQEFREEAEDGDAEDAPASLESQMRRQARRIRAGHAQPGLTLQMPPAKLEDVGSSERANPPKMVGNLC